jgi:16S rRNA (adenine1518-N6/adenine1519-N6)-dimethyltransferase
VPRRLGQHFLTNPAILDRIVAALEPDPDDVVIEVGPGRGTLTARLGPRVGHVIAIEKDRRLVAELLGKGKGETGKGLPPNVRVYAGDALEADWVSMIPEPTFPLSRFPFPGFKVIGNIPYYITTPLIEKALSPPLPRLVVFLVQQEVADRLAAKPGSRTFGALSAGVQSVAAVERLFLVRKGAFHPPPRVDSALVRLRPLAEPMVQPQEQAPWRRFLAGLFSQRRKQLGRGLRALTGWKKEEAEALLRAVDVDPESRPEVLRPQELVRVFRASARSRLAPLPNL